MGRMLAWGGIVLGAVYLIYIGGAWWGIYSSPLRILTMSMAAIALVTWVWVMRRNPEFRPRSVMLPAMAACLGSLAISTVFSRVPRVSVEYLGYAIVLAALYLLLVRLFAHEFFRRRIATLATMLLVVTVMAFLVRVMGSWIHWWDVLGHIAVPPLRPGYEGLTYNNPSAVLTMVALLAVPAAATFGSSARRGIGTYVAIVAAVGVVALLSGSRAGWLAIGITAVIAPIAWLAVADHRRLLRSGVGSLLDGVTGRAALVTGVVLLMAAAIVLTPAILRRATAGGEAERVIYATTAVRIFAESPVVGTGPGTWVIQRIGATMPGERDFYIPHAHNVEVQTLAELGLIGAMAGLVLVANLLWLLRDGSRDPDPLRRRWAWAGCLGLVYFLLHQVLDFYVNMPAFLFAASLPVAYLDATTRQPVSATRFPTMLGLRSVRIGGLVVAIAIAGLLWQEVAATQQDRATAAANDGNWAAADELARSAAELDPDIGSYQLTAGLTAARAGDHAAAARYFARVAERDDLPEAWLNLAAEQIALDRRTEALESLRRSLYLGWQRPVVSLPAGDLALQLGDTELATKAFGSAMSRIPSLAADPWWVADDQRAVVFRAAIEEAVRLAPPDFRWEIMLMAGEAERARDLAAAADASDYAGDIVDAWAGNDSIATQLLNYCRANPLDQVRILWCARLASHRGDIAGANELLDLANISWQSSYVGGAETRVSDSGMTGRQLIGDPADLWATYTYRRPAPWDILVPSLLHLKIE